MSEAETYTASLQHSLHTLHTWVPGLEELVCLQRDGKVLAHFQTAERQKPRPTIVIACRRLMAQMGPALGPTGTIETVFQGHKRFLALYALDSQCILGVLGRTTASIGLLHFASRRVVTQMGEILQAFKTTTS